MRNAMYSISFIFMNLNYLYIYTYMYKFVNDSTCHRLQIKAKHSFTNLEESFDILLALLV